MSGSIRALSRYFFPVPSLFQVPVLLAVVAALATLAAPATAQPDLRSRLPNLGSSEGPSIRFERYGLTDGLAQSSVYRMTQDRHGFIWFGTQGGLHKFDGQQFTVYAPTPFDTTSIQDGWVYKVTEARDGAIWAATFGGSISRLDPATGKFTNYLPDRSNPTSLPNAVGFDVLEAADGTLWAATGSGVSRMDPARPGVFVNILHDHSDPTSFPGPAYFLRETPDGFIWCSTDNGIVRIDPATNAMTVFLRDGERHGANPDPQTFGDSVVDPDDPDVAWFTSGHGLVRLDTRTGESDRYLAFPDDPPTALRNAHYSIARDPQTPDVLWVSSFAGGLLRFDRTTRTFASYANDPSDPNSLPSNQVETVFADRSGTMWVGTTSSGMAKYNPGSVRIAHVAHDAQSSKSLALGGVLWALFSDSKGRLWVGQDDAIGRSLVVRYDPRTGQTTHLTSWQSGDGAILPGYVMALVEDATGRVWIGTDGVSSCDPETLVCRRYVRSRTDSTRLSGSTTHALYQSPSQPQYMWVGTSNAGLQRLEIETGLAKRYVPGDPEKGGAPSSVAYILEDETGVFWLGTFGRGIVRFDRETETFETFSYNPRDTTSIANNHVEVIVERPSEPGVLYIGTQAGIDRFDVATRTATHFGPREGMADGVIYGMLLDDEGVLWASTNRGISSFDPDTKTFRNYGLDDGLRALEFQQNGFSKGQDGTFYFADVGGITAFSPSQLTTNPIAPQVAFTDLRVAGHSLRPEPGGILEKPISDTEAITLPFSQNEFSVDFVALHFSDPSRNRFSYRLDGLSEGWVDAGFQRTATYANLSPGKYTLHVRAANPDGVWNEDGISLRVTVLSPWYRTIWAYLLFAGLFAGLVFAIDRIQRYRLIRQERARSAIQEAELRADAAESEAKALQAENERKKNIERLSEIGKEITASLDFETIFGRLYEHVNELTDAPVFGVGVYNAERQEIEYRMAIENGVRYAPYTRDAKDKNQFPVWCIDHDQPVFINDVENEYSKYIERYVHAGGTLEDGTLAKPPLSLIYLPLTTQDRVLGVITVQSFRKNAYSDDDLNILRTMAAYASVALDNANAYRRLNGTIAELQQTQQQLVQQEKMASLGQLTAGIAHEIKNPLNFVNNFADVNAELAAELRDLLGGADTTDIARKRAEIDDLIAGLQLNSKQIAKHGRRADAIVTGMMEHARPGDAERYPVAVNDFVDEFLNLAWHGQKAQHPNIAVKVVRDYAPSVGNATIAPQEMGRAIVNLVGNAFDVLRDRADGILTISTASRGDQVEIRVRDNGPGVPEKLKSKIFEPFFTTKPTGEGTGLGLSMAHDIVTKGHGGTMRIEDNPEGGATFVISIPVSA